MFVSVVLDSFWCSFPILLWLSYLQMAPDDFRNDSAWLIAPLIWSPAGRNVKLKTSKVLLSATAESWPFPPLKVYSYYLIRRRRKPWWQGSRGVSLFQVDGFFPRRSVPARWEETPGERGILRTYDCQIANFLQTLSPCCSNPFCMEWVNFRYLYKHLLTGFLEH